MILRLQHDDEAALHLARRTAETCGVKLHVSLASEVTDAQFVTRLPTLAQNAEFLRTLSPPSAAVLAAAYDAGLQWIDAPVLTNGRFELPRWLREQAVSQTLHRYGQLIETPSQREPVQGSARPPGPSQPGQPGRGLNLPLRRRDGGRKNVSVLKKVKEQPVHRKGRNVASRHDETLAI